MHTANESNIIGFENQSYACSHVIRVYCCFCPHLIKCNRIRFWFEVLFGSISHEFSLLCRSILYLYTCKLLVKCCVLFFLINADCKNAERRSFLIENLLSCVGGSIKTFIRQIVIFSRWTIQKAITRCIYLGFRLSQIRPYFPCH